MSKTYFKCFAKNWSNEPNRTYFAAGKVILLNTEEPPQPIKSISNIYIYIYIVFSNNIRRFL